MGECVKRRYLYAGQLSTLRGGLCDLLEHCRGLARGVINGALQAFAGCLDDALGLLGCRINVALQVIRHIIHLCARLARSAG